MVEVAYPGVGVAARDVVNIPAQTIQGPTPLRLLVVEVQAVPNYHLVLLTGTNLATGQQITVRVDPDQVQVLPPERPSEPYVVWAAAS
jgi:hypothetical protein